MRKNQISEDGWTYKELWDGCILVSIAHAIFVANAPELAYENSWDGCNYNLNNSQGSRGTVTFNKDYFCAGFRNDEFYSETSNAIDYFGQASDKIIELAEKETLQYLLEDKNGKELPSVTTVLWGNKTNIFSSHPFNKMLERGGDLLEIQSMSSEEAFEACEENYEFTMDQLMLLKKLYRLKVTNPNDKIILSQSDIYIIGTSDLEGVNESKSSFAEIGIEWGDN